MRERERESESERASEGRGPLGAIGAAVNRAHEGAEEEAAELFGVECIGAILSKGNNFSKCRHSARRSASGRKEDAKGKCPAGADGGRHRIEVTEEVVKVLLEMGGGRALDGAEEPGAVGRRPHAVVKDAQHLRQRGHVS